MTHGELGLELQGFRLLDRCFVGAIGFYQRRISPRKGWRCAHAVLHHGPGCSGYVKSVVIAHGWRQAVPLAQARFRECKQAAKTLRAQRALLSGADGGEGGPLGSDSPWTDQMPSDGRQRRPRQQSASQKNNEGCDCADCSGCDLSCCSLADSIGHWHLPHLGCADAGHCDGVGHCCDAPTCDCTPCDCAPGS